MSGREFLVRGIRKVLAKLLALPALQPPIHSARLSASEQKTRDHQARLAALAAGAGGGRLAGKVALVTGAASGIGRATALLFAREGARVVVADIDEPGGNRTAGAITSAGGVGLFVPADVTSDDSIRGAVARAKNVYDKVDVLVNNAGVNVEGGLLTLPPERWQRALDLNLTSIYRCCRFAVPEMVRAGGGSVVNMASVQGIAGFWDSAAYAAAKGGVLSLTRQLARQFAGEGVRVNAVSPGVVATPIFETVANRREMFEAVATHTPLGLIGTPEDVAFASLFLAADESAYVTGQNLVVDGGMTMRGV